jgi:hypothetical protein
MDKPWRDRTAVATGNLSTDIRNANLEVARLQGLAPGDKKTGKLLEKATKERDSLLASMQTLALVTTMIADRIDFVNMDGYLYDDKYFLTEKELVVLYTCLAFTIARKLTIEDQQRTTKEFSSPFWREAANGDAVVTDLAREFVGTAKRIVSKAANGTLNSDEQLNFGQILPLEGIEYKDEASDYRRFCDKTFEVVLRWLGQNRVAGFITKLVKREGALIVRKEDTTGTTLGFGLIRPIIGRYLRKELFNKQRAVGFNTKQAGVAALGVAASLVVTAFGVISGATSRDDQVALIQNAITTGMAFLKGASKAMKDEPVCAHPAAAIVDRAHLTLPPPPQSTTCALSSSGAGT